MINLFGTNRVVPNGYIYTSHKGSEYIYFEGIWFDHKNMKMIDPNKAPRMNEAAIKQIVEHNSTNNNKRMIGESFTFTGRTYTYVGNDRFSEDGVLLSESEMISEVIADGERVYNVPRETLDKQWNSLGFFILPPFIEDVRIPAGFELKGYRFSPKKSRFMNVSDGSIADNMMNRKLWSEASSLAKSMRHKEEILPINSTIMLRDNNSRAEWNGTDFSGTDGEVVVPAQNANNIKMKYCNFVKQNPGLFPELSGAKQAEPDQAKHQSGVVRSEQPSPVTEADESSSTESASITEIPDGYLITSRAGVQYIRKNGQWISSQTKKPMNSSAAMSIDRAAKAKIDKFNETADVKIGDKWKSSKGIEYTYVGDDRFISSKGKLAPKSSAQGILDKMRAAKEPEETEVQQDTVQDTVQDGSNGASDEVEVQDTTTQSTEEPVQGEEGSDLESLARQIKAHPKARKITVLMTRGDKVSLLAADLILAGKEQDAIKILKALNSSDE